MECKYCKNETAEAKNCAICSYPLKGTEQEQSSFVARQIMAESNVKDAIEKLKYPRWILFILGAFNLIIPFTPLFPPNNTVAMIISITMAIMFIGFGVLSFRLPKIALIIPLTLMATYYLILLIFSPTTFFVGLIWKILIIGGLSFGFYRVYDADRILSKNPYLANKLGYDKLGSKKQHDNNLLDKY